MIQEEKIRIEKEKKRIEEEKMNMELHLTDIIDDYKIKMDASWTKMNKIEKHAIEKEMHLHYAFGAIVNLVIIIVAIYFISLSTR